MLVCPHTAGEAPSVPPEGAVLSCKEARGNSGQDGPPHLKEHPIVTFAKPLDIQ
jgi:hypothetical protein